MKFKIELPPRSIENKPKPYQDLRHFFNASSIEELLLVLRALHREGLLQFEVFVSKEYIKWEEAHRTLQLRSDVLKPVDPFGLLQSISRYKMGVLYPKIKSRKPLTESEVRQALEKLPSELAERFMRLRITEIQWDALRHYAEANPQKLFILN